MSNMYSRIASSIVAAFALACAPVSAEVVTGVLVSDSQVTPNHSTGTRPSVPLYAMVKDETTVFHFNQHYSQMPIKWTLELPEGMENSNYEITSASVLAYLSAASPLFNPNSGELKMFGTGFSGESAYTLANWTEASGYHGPTAASATPLQDPYLIELGTGTRAEDNLEATPWAVGVIDPADFDGTAELTEAVPVRFHFDVNNAQVRDYLKAGLDNGLIMFTVASTYPAGQPGGASPGYPALVTKEGVGNSEHGTVQQAALLTIDVSQQASASNWSLYN